MCGIAGWYRRRGRPVAADIIRAQCARIVHRGPDDGGVFVEGDFGFGMRRLSILDVAGGHQPMETPDGRYAIVFNGEIYNHRDLRPALIAAGYAFTTTSDTETVLAAFATWRNDCWSKFEGMFAVAIWDRKTREVTLARDPLGIKPLYLSRQHDGLSFASELKALRVLPHHQFDIDDRSVNDFFSFGHVRQPRSIFRQVSMLEPAHHLTLGAAGEARSQRYWSPGALPVAHRPDGDWTEQMQQMLLESTARHMLSDVPIGAFLSGGIDSSAVLAAMRKKTSAPIKAFTIAYPGAAIDETAAARTTAEHLDCEHIVLPLDAANVRDVLPSVLRCYDEPFADMAAVPTWFASKLASHHVKVVLCGEGGDELFAGYKRHRNARAIERYRPLVTALGPAISMVGNIPVTPFARVNYLRQHIQRFTEFVGLPDGYQQFFAATQISRSALRRDLYDHRFLAAAEPADPYGALEREFFSAAAGDAPALEQFLMADLTVNMPSAMLTRLDRASMAHSVEARVPFLSHKLVEWALSVPTNLKLRGGTGKAILRDAVRPWLPPEIVKRPKQGFQIPHASWLRGDLGTFARELWHDSGAAQAGYLKPTAVDALFSEHRLGNADHGRMLYAIATFGLWWADQKTTGVESNASAA